jgi:2-deoxy-D-gluconate 3-dehydrogenase
MQPFDLSGRVAIVTGGNRGIGRAIALALAKAGAHVAIAARDAHRTTEVVAELEALGRRPLGMTCDVTLAADIATTVTRAHEMFGRLDILVNNAGRGGRAPVEEYPEPLWDQVMAVNVKAPLLFAQATYPIMKKQGGGKIINVSSPAAYYGIPGAAAYGASKAALNNLTLQLAVSWAKDNIQVNALLPGMTVTELTAWRKQQPGMYERWEQRIPAGRWAQPEDIAATAVFLASAGANYLTGQLIVVDGGTTAAAI